MSCCRIINGQGIPADASVLATNVQPVVLLDVDWRTLTTVDFKAGGDGNYTFGGFTWTVGRTVDSDTFGIVNGTGLRYNAAPNAGNSFTNAAQTATHIFLPVAQIPGWDAAAVYLCEMFLAAVTQAVSGDQVHIGLFLNSPGTDRYLAAMRRNSAGIAQTAQISDATINGDAYTDDAIAQRVDGRGSWGVSGTYDAAGNAFPRPYEHLGGSQALAASFSAPLDKPQSRIVHAFPNGSAAGTHDITIARTRVSLLQAA